MFKIIQIAKNWNDTCVRGLEISHWKVRKYRPPLQSSQSNSPRDLRKAVVRLTTWFMHCDVETSTKRFVFRKSLWLQLGFLNKITSVSKQRRCKECRSEVSRSYISKPGSTTTSASAYHGIWLHLRNLEIPPLMVLSFIVCYTKESHSLTSQVAKTRPVLYRPSPEWHLSSYVWKGPENYRSQNL